MCLVWLFLNEINLVFGHFLVILKKSFNSELNFHHVYLSLQLKTILYPLHIPSWNANIYFTLPYNKIYLFLFLLLNTFSIEMVYATCPPSHYTSNPLRFPLWISSHALFLLKLNKNIIGSCVCVCVFLYKYLKIQPAETIFVVLCILCQGWLLCIESPIKGLFPEQD